MADEGKPYDLGYLSTTMQELEQELLAMERNVDPILSTLRRGRDPFEQLGRGVNNVVEDAIDCKTRVWAKIHALLRTLAEHERDESTAGPAVGRRQRVRSDTSNGSGKAVRIVISGVIVEEE